MKQLFDKICNAFLSNYFAASSKSEYVMGNRVPSKYDIRRDFIADLKALKEVAQLRGDMDVVAQCQGRRVTEAKALLAEAEAEDNAGLESE